MKKLSFFVIYNCILLFISGSIYSQTQLYVTPGTEMMISAGETLILDSMWLTPSANFIVESNELSHNSTITNPGLNNYISSVFKFASNSNPFSGSIGVWYADAELNGVDESSLRLYINNGSAWQEYASNNTNDTSANTVITSLLSNVFLNEVTLGRSSSVLSLQWGGLNAWRQGRTVHLQWNTFQEQNIDHYNVERSANGVTWEIVQTDIPAGNVSYSQVYNQTDYDYNPGKIFYRIQCKEFDGSLKYSAVIVVPSEKNASNISVFPNPSAGSFAVSGLDPSTIKHLSIVNAKGAVVKEWSTPMSVYDIRPLAAGTYNIQIMLTSGNILKTPIFKLK